MNDLISNTFEKHFSSVGKEVRPEQREVIESILAGNNTLSIMPTGGGKSLCYWVAGLALQGTTLVIFPLTALMDEQALKLRNHGLDVTVLHSGIPARKQYKELIDLYKGKLPDFIFTSPERLATDGFLEYVLKEKRDQIKLVVIDEIHCISQWGHDFRPFYTEIPPFLDTVFGTHETWPTILGLTATLNQKDTGEVRSDFYIDKSHVLKSQYLLRYPIQVNVIKVGDEKEKDNLFWNELEKHKDEKVLIYIDNRRTGDRSTEAMSARANDAGFLAAYFHAGMSSDAKAEIIRKFKESEIKTVFATSAFGMGIDIPDIRGVIHFRPPESIEQYYQQIGRVGRDGSPSWALLYYSDKNIQFRRSHFIDRSFPGEDEISDAFDKLTAGKGKIKTFNYFGEPGTQSAFHYLIRGDAVNLRCKSLERINIFEKAGKAPLPEFERYQATSRTGLSILVAKKSGESIEEVTVDIYGWLARQQIKTTKSPSKCLIVEQLLDELPEETIEVILSDVEEKRLYRYKLLDELAEILDGFSNSIEFHQEIGRYLGVDKLQLRRIHQTVSGEMVRSKSEVIIANLLTKHRVPFRYEERLEAGGFGFWPDFTVTVDGHTFYWEHLGMLDLEQYRQNWEIKRNWYNRNFPNQLITTEEASTLSQVAERIIIENLCSEDDAQSLEEVSPPEPDGVNIEAIVWTEGLTDWKHLQAAFTRLKEMGRYKNFGIEFQEDEDSMGDKELLGMCRNLSRFQQPLPTFCIFDRDVAPTLKKITDQDKDYKNWGNGVYSIALPLPEHRADTEEISIEFYYQDNEIQRADEDGRRLYIGTEFNERTGMHESGQLVCQDRNKQGKFIIIDNRIYNVSSEDETNVALSKNAFATYVFERKKGFDNFDVMPFVALFDRIKELCSNES